MLTGRRITLTRRLTTLFTLVSATLLLAFGFLVVWDTNAHFVELDRSQLEDKALLVSTMIADAPDHQVMSRQLGDLLRSHNDLYVRIETGDQALYTSDPAVFQGLAPPPQTTALLEWRQDERQFRGLTYPLDPQSPALLGQQSETAQLVVAMDTHRHAHFMADLGKTFLLYLLLAIVLSGLLGWWAARSGLAPLRVMKERARSVSAQHLAPRMPVQDVPVEMADLANSLNLMLDRLEQDFKRLMEFSSDLAHELRTPLNNLLTETQVSLSQPREARAYQEVLASNAEELERLARMVSDMLFLAKTEHDQALPQPETITLDDEVRALFEFYDAVAEDKAITLVLTGTGRVTGNRLMIRRAISNLLSNALRHADLSSQVHATIAIDIGQVALCIINSGPVIEAEHLPRLFDRFYRVDKARPHPETEGTGLGLSITQAIMTAHRGAVSVSSAHGKTTFCLRFPA